MKKAKKKKKISDRDKITFGSVLPSGNTFSLDSDFDFTDIQVLHNSRRFLTLPVTVAGRFSSLEHSAICAMMSMRYCKFMSEKFKKGKFKKQFSSDAFRMILLQNVLCHDVEEAIIGDIPSPVDIPQLKTVEADIRKKIMGSISMSYDDSNIVSVSVKHIDVIAAFTELYIYRNSLDLVSHRNMFMYYKKKIISFEIEEFLAYLSSEMYDFFKRLK